MTGRTAILSRIAKARHETGENPASDAPPEPEQTTVVLAMDHADLLDRFWQQITTNGIIAHRCDAAMDLPTIVAALADKHADTTHSKPQRMCVAPHAAFQDLDWQAASIGNVHVGGWTMGDTIALSHARLGIAESGCLVLASGADSPTGLAFLPDLHIIVLQRSALVATLGDAMESMRQWQTTDRHPLPRAINIISGASRTADIAGKIVQGAHGPRTLGVIIYNDESHPRSEQVA